MTAMEGPGRYVGTETGRAWWSRCAADGLARDGLGDYWLDDQGFRFRRWVALRAIFIPFSAIRAVKLGAWHAGVWDWGRPILKIVWERRGEALSSGFLLPGPADASRALRESLLARLPRGHGAV